MVAVDVLLVLLPIQMLAMNADAKRHLNFEREGAGRNVSFLKRPSEFMHNNFASVVTICEKQVTKHRLNTSTWMIKHLPTVCQTMKCRMFRSHIKNKWIFSNNDWMFLAKCIRLLNRG